MLSKSDFLLFQKCPKHLWAKKHGLLKPQTNTFTQAGLDLEPLAYEYLQNFVLANYPEAELKKQQRYSYDDLGVTADAIIQFPEGKVCLVEIKSGMHPKRYIDDLAFQTLVANHHHQLSSQFIVHLNAHYSRQDELNVRQLFAITDFTAQVTNRVKELGPLITQAKAVLELTNPDELVSCSDPLTCPCLEVCHPNLPEYSVFDAAHLPYNQRASLRKQGIINLVDIPPEYLPRPFQQLQVELTKNKTHFADVERITTELSQLQFPLYFLDYEAYNAPVPLFSNYRPYAPIIFQFCLGRLDSLEATPIWTDYIHWQQQDPTTSLIETLKTHINTPGSIVVWSKHFEASVHQILGGVQPEDVLFLLDLNNRLYDLRDIFSRGYYMDYRFKGSASLKNVLPVLIPHMKYDVLPISEGNQAANAWYKAVFEESDQTKKQQAQKDLIDYCRMDTAGLVEIYKYLVKLPA